MSVMSNMTHRGGENRKANSSAGNGEEPITFLVGLSAFFKNLRIPANCGLKRYMLEKNM